MSEVRDTLILPCRHLCLCNSCANTLRYQANNCPICRAPFRALLQIRALQKTATAILPPVNLPDVSTYQNLFGYNLLIIMIRVIARISHPVTKLSRWLKHLTVHTFQDILLLRCRILSKHQKTNPLYKQLRFLTGIRKMCLLKVKKRIWRGHQRCVCVH